MVRLLVIEDDPDLNRQLAGALTDAGYLLRHPADKRYSLGPALVGRKSRQQRAAQAGGDESLHSGAGSRLEDEARLDPVHAQLLLDVLARGRVGDERQPSKLLADERAAPVGVRRGRG